jgi:hypothetical protein
LNETEEVIQTIGMNQDFFQNPKSTVNGNKNRQLGFHQAKKLLYHKGNNQE